MVNVDARERPRPRARRRVLVGTVSAGLACTLGLTLSAVAGATPARPADRGHPGHGGPGGFGHGFGHRGDHGGVSGTVSGVASNGSSFTLATGPRGLVQLTVDLTGTTTYTEAGAASSISALVTGARVEVRGTMTAANTVTATAVVIAPAASTTPSVTLDGTVSATSGSSFTLTTGEDGLVQVTVNVTSTTTYRTSGIEPRPYLPWMGTTTTTTSTTSTTTSPPPLGGIAVGDKVTVRGTVTAANTMTATEVDIRSTGGIAVTGVVGTVGSSSFTLNRGRSGLEQITVDVTPTTTYAVVTGRPWRIEPPEGGTTTTTSTTTTLAPSAPGLTSLAPNDLVAVRGTVSAPNTITATMVVVLPALGHFAAQQEH